jgi:uroporphyrinogen-III synthase
MRVLITRPEREATTLAMALGERGHVSVIAPLFRLEFLRPPADFAAALNACQAVLLTSANGARALAEASDQRGKPILAVGDTTASTAEGLGFASVTSAAGDAAALVDLVRRRLDPEKGPLVHVSGVDVAVDLDDTLRPHGFDVRRFALYEACAVTSLPDSARAALQARALDAATFFSTRASDLFVRLVSAAGLQDSLGGVTAIAISPAVLEPLSVLPFRATVAAARPSRQAVLDEIDRLAEAGAEGPRIMSDTPSSDAPSTPSPSAPATPPHSIQVRRGIGVIGALITGLVAACLVLAGALISLPYWPADMRALWRGEAAPPPPLDLQAVRQDASAAANAAVDAARREIGARLDDLEKRVRAAAATAAERPPTPPDPAIDELRAKITALENRPAAPQQANPPQAAPTSGDAEKEISALRLEIATVRSAVQALDQAVAGQKDESARQRDQARALADAIDKARTEAGARNAGEQKALAAAHASAVIGVAARLNAALESGLPFAADLGLLAPLAQGDSKLAEIASALQPYAQNGVAARSVLAADFPAVAKAALADDLADDSFGARLMGKVRNLVSLRRVGADVEGDSVEAKLARAEAAIDAGDLLKAVELVKSLPPQTAKATAGWLSRAEAHLAAKRAIDQLAAYAVTLLGAAR